MKLYASNTSPFVRKVRVMILEAGLQNQVKQFLVTGSPLDPVSLPIAENPLGKIPTLVIGDGRAIFDSRVICHYLASLAWPEAYPAGPRLWRTMSLEALADGIIEAALLIVYENRLRPAGQRSSPWIAGQWAKVARALDALEKDCAGDLAQPVCMGHLALGVALGYLDFRHSERDWRAGNPQLADWYTKIARRPALLATVTFDS